MIDAIGAPDDDPELEVLLARVAATDLAPGHGNPIDAALLARDVKGRALGTATSVMFAGYEVLHRIGRGGMGSIYAARDPGLDRVVALKLLHSQRPRHQKRLIAEARALARIAHPNVVTVHAVGVVDAIVFVAMELVEGITLRQWLASPRALVDIAAVFGQIARGLEAAHANRVIHRDFKPDNVILGHDGRVRVVDFGLAVADVEDTPATITASTNSLATAGTPGYIAPEQVTGVDADARADVFAFCVSLYEAVYGRRPHGDGSGLELYAKMLCEVPRARPRSDVPRGLHELVLAGLAIDREQRPASLGPLRLALAALEQPPPSRRGIALGIAVGIALGVLATLAAVFATRSEIPTRQAAPMPDASARQHADESTRARAS